MNNLKTISLSSLALGLVLGVLATPAMAQGQGGPRIQKNASEKSTWYTAPREFQILDDRPVIKDFREAPSAAGSIELPPGPQGGGGAVGGGAMGGGNGGGTLPAGGMALPGGGGPGFRSGPAGLSSLPKSGFGGPSNIPARGIHPGGLLPGVTQGVVGKMMNQQKAPGASGQSKGMSVAPARTVGNSNAPAAASYGGSYGSGSGTSSGSSGRTESSVRGSLLRK